MRLAYVDPRPIPDVRAMPMQLLQTVDGLARAGVEVTLIAPLPRNGAVVEDILGRRLHENVTWLPLFDLRKRWWFPFNTSRVFFRRAAGLLRRLRPDAVMARHLGVADYLQQALPDLPTFFELHEVFADSYAANHPKPDAKQRLKLEKLERRERRVYERAKGLIGLTDELGRRGRTRYGVDTPVVTIPNGVDLVLARQALDGFDGQERDGFHVLYLGGLHPWKGVNLAVEAVAQVADAHLDVVGAGGGGDVGALKALAEKLGCADRVNLQGSVLPPARRFEVIAQADACILPLLANPVGTSPLKLFEYLAMGKPTVMAGLPSIRELVEDGRECLLAEAGNAPDFARALRRISEDRVLRECLGRRGRERAGAFGWERRGERLRAFFDSVRG